MKRIFLRSSFMFFSPPCNAIARQAIRTQAFLPTLLTVVGRAPCFACLDCTAVDGVCLQTSESIGCAEELGLPAVVVLNKIDLLPEEEAAQVYFVSVPQMCVLMLSVRFDRLLGGAEIRRKARMLSVGRCVCMVSMLLLPLFFFCLWAG